MLLQERAKKEFKIAPITSAEVDWLIDYCAAAYRGKPEWEDAANGIKTVNFAKSICSETARLATLSIGIQIEGGERGQWLQEQVDSFYYRIRQWVEFAAAYGTVILKPTGDSVKLYLPGQFIATEQDGTKITGAVFHNTATVGDQCYVRLEHHRFEDGVYCITNRCYTGNSPTTCDRPISIERTPWADLSEEARILNVEKPLFAVMRTPGANYLDADSPVGLPVFADALEELRDLDVAYSRNATEIEDSKRTVMADDSLIAYAGQKVNKSPDAVKHAAANIGLPPMVKLVRGDGQDVFYQEINPELRTDERLKGINALLSQIGYKIGFSNGYFVFNESTGIQTATGVEAEQQRTVQFIKDVRDQTLQNAMDDLIYALSKVADLFGLAPAGSYEITYDFGDITYNREEDRARWYGYAVAGKIPFWYYLTKFEGFTEQDAKAMEKAARPAGPTLFGPEE